jgi:hypothetical protein
MEILLQQASGKTLELIIGSFITVSAFFFRRTLSNYDRRIRDMELKHDKIMEGLIKIDKQVTAIATKLEFLGRP